MNIRNQMALAAAVILPLGGLGVLGGFGAVGAAASPDLTCTVVGPASGDTGGETFSGGANGVYFNADNGTPSGKAAAVTSSDWASGTNTVVLDMVVVTGETFSIPAVDSASGSGDNTFTITTAQSSGSSGSPYPTTVTVVPALQLASSFTSSNKPLPAKTAVTVSPTTTTPYATENNITVSSGTGTVTFPTSDDPDLSNMSFAPIAAQENGINLVPSDTYFTYTGAGTGQLENDTDTGTVNATRSGTATAVVGFTDFTSANVTTTYNLAASGCSTTDVAGIFAPNEATITGTSGESAQDSILSLLDPPTGANLTVSYPPLSAGYADNGGTGATTASSTVTFASGKDSSFYLTGGPGGCSYCDSFIKGTVTGDYPSDAGALSLSLVPGGIVACTDGQLQAIDYGTGIDAAPGPSHVALGANPLDVCDSVELSPIMPQIIAINSSQDGSDGTPYAEIVNIRPLYATNAVV